MKRLLIPAILFVSPFILLAQKETTPVKGLHTNTPRVHALINGTAVTAPGKIIESATIVVRDGLIESVGTDIEVPSDARVWDMTGKTVYAGFIDAYSNYGMPPGLKKFRSGGGSSEGPAPKRPSTPGETGPISWNPLVTPERDAGDYFNANKKETDGYNDAGFTTVATYPARGIYRGQGLLIHTDKKSIQESRISTGTAHHIAFDRWQDSRSERPNDGDAYPASLMGSVALVRQTLHDANWYGEISEAHQNNPTKMEQPDANAALAALQPLISQKQWALFETKNELAYQRIQTVAEEFDLEYAMLGNGYEYRRTEILKGLGKTIILPLSFPKTPHVERTDKSLGVSLEQLQHWELAASNAAFLEEANVQFCFTTHFNSGPNNNPWNAIRETVKRGLHPDMALAAITTNPAKLYDVENRLGTIETGKIANLTVSTGDIFIDEKAVVSELWIQGSYIDRKAAGEKDLEGIWTFNWTGVSGFESGEIKGSGKKFTLKAGKTSLPFTVQGNEFLLLASPDLVGEQDGEGWVRLQAYIRGNTLSGSGQLPDGKTVTWTATRTNSLEDDKKEDKEKESEIPELVFNRYPAGIYGVESLDRSETVLVQNATVWTSGSAGVLEDTDLLIVDGKIAAIGTKLKIPRNAQVIDAEGKHVTPGMIDCHSHVGGTGGLNEGGSATSVEVRIGDVLNPADINIFRQLGGGLTAANILHGSANPMGGQSQVIKMRWGQDAEGIKFEGARPSVKFALGENVKRSRDPSSSRYPNSRLGVEQFFVSNFRAAEDYERKLNDFSSGKSITPTRVDLRKEATLEVLRRERIIHIHSYRQDEILMFARLAKKLNLEVGTFQHILEGYKVADALADINAGASTFSDWWGYKFEVIDAIPYNGKILHDQGVVTSFNSDDVYAAELATRLNTEAAKAVKYGGLSEEEALKFVTLNPAIQLRIDDRVGSLEKGKDGDFVIWSDHPLSTFAHAEQTWIEGIKYFDKENARNQFEADNRERNRLVQKALGKRLKELNMGSKNGPPDKDPPGDAKPEETHDWIYHDGTHQYSCAAEEEGAHL